jgi:enoyl-[acyl-carrier protein] reductase III
MVKEFDTYWAVILGGSSGLGLASAINLAQHGMNICIIHRNTRAEMPLVAQGFEEIKALGVRLLTFNIDVLDGEKRREALAMLQQEMGTEGKVRCMLHSIAKGNLKAMVSEEGRALQTDDFQITLNNMAISLYDWMQAIHAEGLFAADARVISFTSEGNQKAWKHYAAVSAAKAALEAISRNIALEFAPFGIRANCIQAGLTPTASLKRIPGHEALTEHSLQRNPFKRLTTPQDIAGMVYLLCKDEAAWVNGTVIPVDGGEHIS